MRVFKTAAVAAGIIGAAILIGAPAKAATTYTLTGTFNSARVFGSPGAIATDLGLGPLDLVATLTFARSDGVILPLVTSMTLNGGPALSGFGFVVFNEFHFGGQADYSPNTPGIEGAVATLRIDHHLWDDSFAVELTPDVLLHSILEADLAAGTSISPGSRVRYRDFVLTDVAVDGPVLTVALPEPSSWALMIMGFGGVGAALRRRQEFA